MNSNSINLSTALSIVSNEADSGWLFGLSRVKFSVYHYI